MVLTRVKLVLQGLDRVLLGFTGFYWVLQRFARFFCGLHGFEELNLFFFCALQGLTECYCVGLVFTWVLLGFYWVLMSFNGFYWILLGEDGVSFVSVEPGGN